MEKTFVHRLRFITFFCLIVTLFLLSGCPRKSTKKLEVWTISLQPLFTSYMNEVIHDWEKTHPGIQVDWVDLPLNAIQQKLIAAFASDSPPSVVNLNTEMAFQLTEAGALLNMDQFVRPEVRALYFPGLWNAVNYQGSSYAIPWYVTTEVLIYNADIFSKAGLDPNNPPTTWDELVEDSKEIKDKTGLYGWFPAIKFIQDLEEQGIPVVDSERRTALFDQPEAVKRLAMYVDLFRNGTIPRETLSLSKAYQQAVDLYQAGRLAVLQTGPQFLNRVRDSAPSVYSVTRVAPLPLGKGKVIGAATMNLVVPRNAPLIPEAIDFATFLTNDKNQLKFSQVVLVFPSTRKASSDPFFKTQGADPLIGEARKIGASELRIAKDLTLGLKNSKARNEAIRDALENALMGRKSPYQALHDAALLWDKLLK